MNPVTPVGGGNRRLIVLCGFYKHSAAQPTDDVAAPFISVLPSCGCILHAVTTDTEKKSCILNIVQEEKTKKKAIY